MSEVESFFANQTQNAQLGVAGALDDDPEQAARSLELSSATGVPAPAIYGDVEGFERQHKVALSSAIVSDNRYIADYLNSHPLASRLSHDDLGQLDGASRAMGNFKDKTFAQQAHEWLKSDSIARNVVHGFGDQPLGTMFVGEGFKPTGNPILDSWYKFSEATARAETMVPELFLRSLNAAIYGGSTTFLGQERGERFAQVLMDPAVQAMLHGIGGPIRPIQKYTGETIKADIRKDGGKLSDGVEEYTKSGGYPAQISDALRAASPWLRAGRDVPVGIHPELDKIKIEQAKTDVDVLSNTLKESVKSATRERSQDMYANFARLHPEMRSDIGISADAIRELYGDKTPQIDDNILGWVPGMADKLANSEATGGDVRVPMADYLAKVDPEVHKALEDHIRVRPDGITLDEGAKLKEAEPKEVVDEPHAAVRGHASLEPLFSIGDRKVKLERMKSAELIGDDQAKAYAQSVGVNWNNISEFQRNAYRQDAKDINFQGRDTGFHDFDITDETGKKVGSLNLSEQKDGRQIYIEMIQAGADKRMYDPNFLGPSLIRDLYKQLKAEFPKAFGPDGLGLTGHRVSGAREKAGSWELKSAMPVVKAANELSEQGIQHFRDLLSPFWKDEGQGVEALYKPTETWSAKEKELSKALQEEVQRIAPGVELKVAHAIHNEGATGTVRGVYIQGDFTKDMDNLAKVIVSLDGTNPAGVLRHEAIHHLKRMGMISQDEWFSLTRQARADGWLDKYQINKRYPNLDMASKLEEAVAEGYKYWKDGQLILKDDGVFQKIKDFFERLQLRFKEILGRDFTWEELFQKIDQGEVGRRDPNSARGRDMQPVESAEVIPFRANDNVYNRENKLLEDYSTGRKLPLAEAREAENILLRRKLTLDDVKEGKHLLNPKFSIDEPFQILDIGGKEAEALREKIGKMSGELQVAKATNRDKLPEFEQMAKDLKEHQAQLRSITSGTFGMSVKQYERYMKLIKDRNEADLEAASKRALEQQRRSQTKEWKANRVEVRDEVREDFESRPEVALDQMMAQEKLKFHPDSLTEEQKASLPKDYIQKKDGISPDDLAGYLGFASGDTLIARLADITADRKASGLNARDWMNKIIDAETDKRMEERFGNLDQRILEEAKDQAISETQLDLLHEEVLHLGLLAKSEFPISKSQLRQWNREIFDKTPIGQISTDDYLRIAGKAGKAAEMSLLKEDFADAFREKQRQNNAMIMASYAKEYEKARRSFDRVAKTFQKREVPSVSQEWTNWIHDILQRTGNRVNRSVQDLAENIGRQSEKTLQDFIEAKEAETFGLRETPVADFLLDPNFRKEMKDLTADEFYAVKNSLDVLVKQGRDEKKIYVAGEAADRAAVLTEMREKLQTFPVKALPDEAPISTALLKLPRMYMAGMTNIETLLNRWDRADPRGIFNRYLMQPLAKAANYKSALQREYARMYGELGEIKDGDKLVDAPFADPLSRSEIDPNGRPWPGFTRKHVLAMLQNAGNKSNWKVLAKGYSADPEALMQWLHQHTTKEDWVRAQKLGDLFHSLVAKADTVYENITGATIEKIPLEPIETPYGTFRGWYHPLVADPIRKEVWVKDADTGIWQRNATGKRVSVLDDSDYFHASTANGYTKRRTGAIYPLDLSFDSVPSRIKQMIHDIAFRQVIVEAEKIMTNRALQAEVTKHYGSIYTDLMEPYLRNLAGAESIPSKAGAKAAQISEYLRQNVISTYIGFNPFTAMKHGPTALVMSSREVGTGNFLSAVKSLYGQSPELGLSNSEFAMKYSEELQRRERHWQDTIAGQHNEIEGATNLREKIIEKGSWLVAQSDMLSAKPTWVAAYNKYIGDGLSHGESVDLADRAVRRAHGSTAETNQPALVRGGGPLHGWLTSVYGFFGTAMQRRIEIAHKLNDTYQLGKEGEIKKAAANLPGIMTDIMTYVVWPTLVEEAVVGMNTEDHKGLVGKIAAAGTMGIASSMLYFRDLVHAFTTGHDPSPGLIGSPLHDVANVVRDIRKGKDAFNKQHAGKTVSDLITVLGDGTGMAPKAIGSAARFGIDLVNKQQHPKGAAEWLRGLSRGQSKQRKEH